MKERDELISFLRTCGIGASFHFVPLHLSFFYKNKYKPIDLPNAVMYGDKLVRLPLYPDLKNYEIDYIIDKVTEYVRLRS